ncbi:hypothetical protein ACFCY8_11320 [Streptomyces noursei]|uniref:hypothetical protein n=1 Tax=Streptomyces noursei TaxID=1971 RepID=UPI0035E0D9D0
MVPVPRERGGPVVGLAVDVAVGLLAGRPPAEDDRLAASVLHCLVNGGPEFGALADSRAGPEITADPAGGPAAWIRDVPAVLVSLGRPELGVLCLAAVKESTRAVATSACTCSCCTSTASASLRCTSSAAGRVRHRRALEVSQDEQPATAAVFVIRRKPARAGRGRSTVCQ